MRYYYTKHILLLIFYLLSLAPKSNAQANMDEHRIKVVMREVGHEILLFTGDLTSLVLPIEKIGDRYKIEFENDFQIDPFDLSSIVDTVFRKNKLTNKYRVEVEKCENNYVAHSYELSDSIQPDEIACRGRILPKDCYNVYITFLDTLNVENISISTISQKPYNPTSKNKQSKILIIVVLSISLIFFVGLFMYYRRKRGNTKGNSNLISIGKFEFDKRNQTLQHVSEKIDLSSKETDLLYLLYSSENTVIKREEILNAVWGDEGDYIGRTLDVFISKLRKKLASDPRLKIINVHGVGYKFVVNE